MNDTLSTLIRVHESFSKDELLELAEEIHYPKHLTACLNVRQLKNVLSQHLSPLVELV